MTKVEDRDTVERAMRLRRMTNDALRKMTPQVWDRLLQVHLAQARGLARNGDLVRQTMDRTLHLQPAVSGREGAFTVQDALIETLTTVVDILGTQGASHAVTGSIASSVHGEPYASLDVDLIVQASPAQAAAIARELSPRFYAPEDRLSDAARDHAFANVVDNRTGLKVDLSFIPDSGFLTEVLRRRKKTRIGSDGPEFDFVTPEDIILMKLDWRKETKSSKQWDNALSVAQVQGARMDWTYLFEQARALGIEDDLIRLRDEAGI